MDETTAGVAIPACALTENIIKMYLSGTIPDITQVVMLSNTDFLVYKGRRPQKEGMTYEEAVGYLQRIVGSREWVGQPVVLQAMPLTLGEGRSHMEETRDFIQSLTLTKIQQKHLTAQEVMRKRLDQD